jgi:phage-related protein
MDGAIEIKPLFWMGSSQTNLREFPDSVKGEFGFALYQAQKGSKHIRAKPMRGFGGASVLEIVEDHDGDTYSAVYTVRFKGAIYVFHAFQKKLKHGIKTPQSDIDLIKSRLRQAEAHYEQWKKRN